MILASSFFQYFVAARFLMLTYYLYAPRLKMHCAAS